MKIKQFAALILHLLFCAILIYWFYNRAIIRPYTVDYPYKEIICAVIVLVITYLNYLFLVPKLIFKNYYLSYLLVSLIVIGISGIAEIALVASDIRKCLFGVPEAEFRIWLRGMFYMVTLRNGGFYLFFTVIGIYKYSKKCTLRKEKEILKKESTTSFLMSSGKAIALKTSKIIYFKQERNKTKIYTISGKCYAVYSSLYDLGEFYEDKCLRINRNTIVIVENIITYNKVSISVLDGNSGKLQVLDYYKEKSQHMYQILQKKLPLLDEEIVENIPKKEGFGSVKPENFYNDNDFGSVNDKILEEIRLIPGINGVALSKQFSQISVRTLNRRLVELKKENKIEFRGAPKTGGYFVVEL